MPIRYHGWRDGRHYYSMRVSMADNFYMTVSFDHKPTKQDLMHAAKAVWDACQ